MFKKENGQIKSLQVLLNNKKVSDVFMVEHKWNLEFIHGKLKFLKC